MEVPRMICHLTASIHNCAYGGHVYPLIRRTFIFSCFRFSLKIVPEDQTKSSAEHVVRQVMQRLQDMGNTVFLTPDYTAQSPVPVLLQKGLNDEEIVTLMTEQKEHWLSLKGQCLSMLLEVFTSFQIETRNVILMLAKEPKILKMEEKFLINRLSGLKSVFGVRTADPKNSYNFNKLLLNHPYVLLNDTEIEAYIETKSRLINFFSSKEINYMLKNYPWILTYDPDQLELSYEYFHFVMGLQPREIAGCDWYKHPLNEVHLRFKFATQSGNYIKPHPKKPSLSADNIELAKLLNTSNKHFANMCNCNPEEFDAFCTMYADEFGDLERIKNEIEKNAQFSIGVHKRYASRRMDDDEDSVEVDEVDDAEEDNSPLNDRPIMVNKQWNEKWGRKRK